MHFFRRLVPKKFLSLYHLTLAWCGAVWYWFPSRRMIVIGVTGTSGKSTTVYFLTELLRALGEKVCALSTIEFVLPGERRLNDKKMTMLGRFQIQKFLRCAAAEGCRYAVIETTSEGVVQYRHRFINYDVGVLTNLYPEHIESHGSFENYKAAKVAFFRHVAGRPVKLMDGHEVPRVFVVNGESEHADEFLTPFSADKKICFGRHGVDWRCKVGECSVTMDANVIPGDLPRSPHRGAKDTILSFELFGQRVETKVIGEHNIMNILAAAAALVGLGFEEAKILRALPQLSQPPGRLEQIDEGQPFSVIVDYAFEPVAMEALYKAVARMPHQRILHAFGATGGGRDRSRRRVLGEFVGRHADLLFITDEDPYDEDPLSIINEVAAGAMAAGRVEGKDMWKISDRREAIVRAVNAARAGDIVFVTGKGCEQAIVMKGGKKIPWDDRAVVRDALRVLGKA